LRDGLGEDKGRAKHQHKGGEKASFHKSLLKKEKINKVNDLRLIISKKYAKLMDAWHDSCFYNIGGLKRKGIGKRACLQVRVFPLYNSLAVVME
jgi:hypothetical protein